MVRIPKPNSETTARLKIERNVGNNPTFEQQVQMARSLIRQGENWMGFVQDLEMRRKIQEAI